MGGFSVIKAGLANERNLRREEMDVLDIGDGVRSYIHDSRISLNESFNLLNPPGQSNP